MQLHLLLITVEFVYKCQGKREQVKEAESIEHKVRMIIFMTITHICTCIIYREKYTNKYISIKIYLMF